MKLSRNVPLRGIADTPRQASAPATSAVSPTQAGAIKRAGEIDPEAAILVERVRDTKLGGRDKWRKP